MSTINSDPSSNFTEILPTKSPSFSVFLFLSVASVIVAPSKSLFILSLFSSFLTFIPFDQSISSPTHFLISTGSRSPSSVTWSALVFVTFKFDSFEFCLSELSTYSPLSVTKAFTSVSFLIFNLSIVIRPVFESILAKPPPSEIVHVLFSKSCVATIFFS